MCQILDYQIKMTQSAFQTLVQLERAHLRMTYPQMVGTTDFVSRPWNPIETGYLDQVESGWSYLLKFRIWKKYI